jgi:protein-tyrosine-phosphatase
MTSSTSPSPTSVLFACTQNSVRSPMAVALLKQLHHPGLYVDSVGVKAGELDGFMVAAMNELDIDLSRHQSKTFDDLDDDYFDLVITLSPEAHHRALEMTRTMSCEVEYWPIFDPTAVEGSREKRLDAYREVRDTLMQRIRERLPPRPTPNP